MQFHVLDLGNLPAYLFRVCYFMQEKYEEAMASIAEMEKRVVMAESMLEATLQYQTGQLKTQPSPRYIVNQAPYLSSVPSQQNLNRYNAWKPLVDIFIILSMT